MPVPKSVSDYEELRKLIPPGPAGEYVFVSGFPDPQNSGLQGFFAWRPNSVAADNGGTVIKPKPPFHSKGRWYRVFEGPISVQWFGAKANGFANASMQAAINAAAIQKAIDVAHKAGGGTVYVPPAADFYAINKYLYGQDDVTIKGAGYASFIKNIFAPRDLSKINDATDPVNWLGNGIVFLLGGYESVDPWWIQGPERWPRLSEQIFRVDKWSLCRG